MLDIKYNTVFTFAPAAFDCRGLRLAFEFYQLTRDEVCLLTQDVLRFWDEITAEQFVGSWSIDGKDVSNKAMKQYVMDVIPYKAPGVLFYRGCVRSSIIPNKTAAIVAVRKRNYDPDIPLKLGVSTDYMDYCKSRLGKEKPDKDRFLEFVRNTFRLEDKRIFSYWPGDDLRMTFHALPYKSDPSGLYGAFRMEICGACLGEKLNPMAELWRDYLQKLSEKYGKINGRVMFQPARGISSASPYMRYFGCNLMHDFSHEEMGLKETEWYPTYYLCGVEWANVISPLAATHVPQLKAEDNLQPDIQIKSLNSGGILVASKRPINEFDVSHLRTMKELVYPALYPGRSAITFSSLFFEDMQGHCHFNYMNFPREDWANVPMLDHEIDVVSTCLVYSHH